VYKPAFPHEQAVDIIRAGRGNHFDPDVADAFLDIAEEFRAIATRYADDGAHAEAEAGAPV
jgi:putative two-component system response regulator